MINIVSKINIGHILFLHGRQGCSLILYDMVVSPISGLSKTDPKVYTYFEFYVIEIHKHLENI